ncbi:MAG: hypothetical protein EP348_01070 [Alphaproteobacteria bacterium]|nr:MAG: hypothetical protein EP348_01070 [Alphaproteobacteria bacterium]
MPGLCLWVEQQLKPLLGKIRSRLRREVIEKRFQEAKKSAMLETILIATDIERQVRIDEKEYGRALKDAVQSERQARQIEAAEQARRIAAEKYGSWVTSVLSITALLASMVLSALYFAG